MRCARSLFTADVLAVLKVKLPRNPFAGVKLKDPGAQRYHSDVNPELLLVCADREMREKHVLYLYLRQRERIYLLYLFTKGDADNLSAQGKKAMRELAQQIRREVES
jgi:hypothetical protein